MLMYVIYIPFSTSHLPPPLSPTSLLLHLYPPLPSFQISHSLSPTPLFSPPFLPLSPSLVNCCRKHIVPHSPRFCFYPLIYLDALLSRIWLPILPISSKQLIRVLLPSSIFLPLTFRHPGSHFRLRRLYPYSIASLACFRVWRSSELTDKREAEARCLSIRCCCLQLVWDLRREGELPAESRSDGLLERC